MPRVHVKKSIVIDAPMNKVHATLSDFNSWTAWSPWLIMEPEAKVTVREDNKFYEWSGKRVGAGNMTITGEDASTIHIDLLFLKPFKSRAKVRFELKEVNNQTEVDWIMETSLPFFMFWMKKSMTVYIGMDFDRGLRLVKEFIELGHTLCQLELLEVGEAGGYDYIGIKTACTMETMQKKMAEDFPKLMEALDSPENIVAEPFTQYHKWDIVGNKVEYTVGIPVKTIPANLPTGFTSGNIPKVKVQSAALTGPYHHLGNAWSLLYQMQRYKEFKINKAVDPFEAYINSPAEVAPKDLKTIIHFPIQ